MTEHIQQFEPWGGPAFGRENLPKLRDALAKAELDGVLIPHEDEYDNEYLPAYTQRLAWATGFTGSAGAAIVMRDRAAVFVDGRYTIQVRDQVDPKLFAFEDLVETGLGGWIKREGRKGERVGYDPRLHAPDRLAVIERAAQKAGVELVAIEPHPIDQAWTNRPAPPSAPVTPHPIAFAGENHADKRARVGANIADAGADAAAITAPASIAWLFNIRGGDVQCSPLPLSSAILNADGTATLFIEESKLDAQTREHLGNAVEVRPEAEFGPALEALSGKTVIADPASASVWVFQRLEAGGAQVKRQLDPVSLPKACKNPAEVEGARQAHTRDGAAIVRFLHWLDTEAQSGEFDEIQAAVRLEDWRRKNQEFRDLSFETISGAGPNGALPHYRVNTDTVRKLERGSLYLVDSGGQYPDGTTDITRTVPIGEPTAQMRRHFTLVLRGHIALSRIRFPKGVSGAQLDALARQPLWMAGLDYDHGTGHGVGSYLGVHEGPQRIGKMAGGVALEPGMIVSNEPGYYKDGAYGIRIENLQVVTSPEPVEGGEREMLGFETLTMAPIHRGLIDHKQLDAGELAWLDAYHAEVRKRILPLVDGETASWLVKACEPLYGATP